jgi:pectin methylesterase-like acyl-CoA thioesterase
MNGWFCLKPKIPAKMKTIRKYALISFLFLLSGSAIIGQTGLQSASARWELTDPATGGTGFNVATEGQVEAMNETFSNTEAPNYTGPESSQRIRIIGNSWPAGLTWQIDTLFVQFAVSPRGSNRLYVDSLSMKICAMSSSTMEANIYYSKDPDFATSTKVRYVDAFSDNYLTTTALELLALNNLNIDVEPGETFYIRIYFWNEDAAVKTGKYICLQNVYISGQTESLRTAASVTWFENGLETPVVSGGLLANAPFYSDSMTLYSSTTSLPLNGSGGNVTAGAVHTVSKSWNAEPDTVSYLYFGGSVRPKTGGTFHIDSVTLNIGGWYSADLKAALFYSLHPDFSNATLLKSDTQLPRNTMDHWSVSLDTNIYTGEVFYLRIYPYSTAAAGWAKLVAINDLKIFGSTIGVTADPPTVNTAQLSYLSTTFVTCGGNIPNDGGALITGRGVVWDTISHPTVKSNKTSDGTGSGSFVSFVTGLTPGESYFLRAYAINKADTSYGEERTFTTLDSVLVPSVVTSSVSAIMVKTAESGGEVTGWGGDTVTARGICWDTVGSPTLEDNFTVNGEGLGTYKSIMAPLAHGTTYYARAYATNSAGTGYGNQVSFTTQLPAPDVTKVVAWDGSGDYATVQAAFNAVPDLYTGSWTIYVKPGVYKEKLLLAKNKVNVVLKADHPDSVILTYDDYAGKSNGSGGTLGTSGSYSTSIDASDFRAEKITFRNTVKNDGTFANQQAVALRTNGDRQSYYHCRLLGYQDTYYTYGLGRIYMKDCYIEGSVDFIFGQATAVFDSCELNVNRSGGVYTAASTNTDSKFGYVFRGCELMTATVGFDGSPVSSVYLGRPWQGNPKVVYMFCHEPATVARAGWTSMNAGLNPLFAEYQCSGPGYKPDQRSTDMNYRGVQLTDENAAAYTLENIFAMTTNPSFGIDWMPDTGSSKLTQSISFDPLPGDKKVGDEPYTLTATASSNLPVSYVSSNTDVATVSGNSLTFLSPGTTDITASQEGNFLYQHATDVIRTIAVGASAMDENAVASIRIFPNPAGDRVFIIRESAAPVTLDVINGTGQRVVSKVLAGNHESLDISGLSKGIYIFRLEDRRVKVVVE